MTKTTKATILREAKALFAEHGYEGFSMRTLAARSGVGLSSIYHFFADKDVVLQEIFDETNSRLGLERSRLPHSVNAAQALYDRIQFQFEHIEDVVFVLKYYLHFRQNFAKHRGGYVPAKAYLHIEEVLIRGIDEGTFAIDPADIDKEAKVVAHAINGFLLEYYPEQPKADELSDIVLSIHTFILKSLTNKEAVAMA